MQTLANLEVSASHQPNSLELNHALAEKYFERGKWEDAARAYRSLFALEASTASLFIDRIRLGAAALMIASVMVLAAMMIQPPLSIRSLTTFATAISSPAYFASQLLNILALALYSCSTISTYKLLSYTRAHRPAFWAMVVSVIGVGLSMPALGIKSFIYPLIGSMYLEGKTDMMAMYVSLNEDPMNMILGVGNYLVVAGILIFAWVVWRNGGLSLRSLLIFLTGWVGLTTLPNIASLAFGALVALGGLGFGISLWNQASTQFEAGMDRSKR